MVDGIREDFTGRDAKNVYTSPKNLQKTSHSVWMHFSEGEKNFLIFFFLEKTFLMLFMCTFFKK